MNTTNSRVRIFRLTFCDFLKKMRGIQKLFSLVQCDYPEIGEDIEPDIFMEKLTWFLMAIPPMRISEQNINTYKITIINKVMSLSSSQRLFLKERRQIV